jgi:hypothetical protein
LIDLKSGNRAGYGAANLSRICGELDRCVDYFLLVVFERKTSKGCFDSVWTIPFIPSFVFTRHF